MLKHFKGDLHIHSCLSPCACNEMLPTAIVKQAKKKNLDLIAICDHNSAENVAAIKRAGAELGLAVIGGMEITTQEEVHVLGLFDNDQALEDISKMINQNLAGKNDKKYFGEQLIVDESDRVIGSNERLLIGATALSIEKVVRAIHEREGLAIASHVDREAFSILGQLGMIPPGIRLDALELSSVGKGREEEFYRKYDFPFVHSSDAHYLKDIGKSHTSFFMEEVSIEEMKKALQGKDKRNVTLE